MAAARRAVAASIRCAGCALLIAGSSACDLTDPATRLAYDIESGAARIVTDVR